MKGKISFDERQLEIRSRIFQRSFFMVVSLIVANTILENIGIKWAVENWSYFLIVMLILTITLIELSINEVMYSPKTERRCSIMMVALGVYGLLFMVFCLFAPAHTGFMEDRYISSIGCGFISGAMFMTVGAVFVVKKVCLRHRMLKE